MTALANNWPDTLPLPSVDYGGDFRPGSVWSADEHSRIQRRRRFLASQETLKVTWNLDSLQFAAFRTFIIDDLSHGFALFSIRLRYPLQSDLQLWAVQLMGELGCQHGEGDVWKVSVDLRLVRQLEEES